MQKNTVQVLQSICNGIIESITNKLNQYQRKADEFFLKEINLANLSNKQSLIEKVNEQLEQRAEQMKSKLYGFQNSILAYDLGQFEKILKPEEAVIELDELDDVQLEKNRPKIVQQTKRLQSAEVEDLTLDSRKPSQFQSKRSPSISTTPYQAPLTQTLTSGTPSQTCPICFQRFDAPQNLVAHAQSIHGQDLSEKFKNVGKPYPLLSTIDRNILAYTCGKCTMKVTIPGSFVSYRKHLLQVHQIRNWFKCIECSQKYEDQMSLSAHIFQLHKKRLHMSRYFYKCKATGREFFNQDDLNFHIQNVMAYHLQVPDGFDNYRYK